MRGLRHLLSAEIYSIAITSVYVEQVWSRDVVGVAEDLALNLMWDKNAVERNKIIVYN